MIKRIGSQWTTVQCKNPRWANEEPCNLCFKVLNGRFALIQQCPYCLGKINLRDCVIKHEPDESTEAAVVETGTQLLWEED